VLDLFQGLQNSGIDNFQYLLTGYLPDAATVAAVGSIAEKLKKKDPNIIWSKFPRWHLLLLVLDPVMGDDGHLYVAKEVVPVYKSIVPKADIILPNQYEAEWLSDCTLDTIDSIVPCLDRLHQVYQVKNIVISSLRLISHPGVILCCGSTARTDFTSRAFMIEASIINGSFVGTGDLFAALLLARLHPFAGELAPKDLVSPTELPLAKAVELVMASMQGVLLKTKDAMDKQFELDGDRSLLTKKEIQVAEMRACELRLVGSQDDLVRPQVAALAVEL